jgi:hypothetical protein
VTPPHVTPSGSHGAGSRGLVRSILEPRKRRKVVISPNSKFADIEAIHRAQVVAGDCQDVLLDSDGLVSIASTLSHITME